MYLLISIFKTISILAFVLAFYFSVLHIHNFIQYKKLIRENPQLVGY